MNIIPEPQIINYIDGGKTQITAGYTIHLMTDKRDDRVTKLIENIFMESIIHYETNSTLHGVALTINCDIYDIPDNIHSRLRNQKESYYLQINNNTIMIYANDIRGLFYGMQTLKQIIENNEKIQSVEIIDWPDIPMRCMYLDLRMIFPSIENLIQYLEGMARYKVNSLIIEYEDKLPFKHHAYLKHKEFVLTQEQLLTIQKIAQKNFIEIIPLQQCFGHLEYVLKHKKNEQLRECWDELGEICPSHPQSLELSISLLEEMINLHPESTYVHMGCDEVWSLCRCQKCISEFNNSRGAAFVDFVNKLIEYVANRGKTPIIWHDMLEGIDDEHLAKLDKRVNIMIWIYNGRNLKEKIRDLVDRFRAHELNVMGAPSVRCHDGKDNQNYPVASNRIENIIQWTDAAVQLNIQCIVSTNWTAAFSLGCPYGIFETSIYLMCFSAEQYWNVNSNRQSFMIRFLKDFHGIEFDEIPKAILECSVEDYYTAINDIVPIAKKHKRIAQLIQTMLKYEMITEKHFPANLYIFRGIFYQNEEIEKISLKTKYNRTMERLQEIQPEMQEQLAHFLPDGMVNLYISSRYFMYNYLNRHLHQLLFP